MPEFEAHDPGTGDTLVLEGDSPPTEKDLDAAFAEYSKRLGHPSISSHKQTIAERIRGLKMPDVLGGAPIGRNLLGPTSAEKEVMAQGGLGVPSISDIPEVAFDSLTLIPPVREAVKKVTDVPLHILPDSAGGVIAGARDFGLEFPVGALFTGAGEAKAIPAMKGLGRAAQAVFTGQFALSIPEQKQAFDAAMQRGDKREAYRIATKGILMGAILGVGAEAQRRSIMSDFKAKGIESKIPIIPPDQQAAIDNIKAVAPQTASAVESVAKTAIEKPAVKPEPLTKEQEVEESKRLESELSTEGKPQAKLETSPAVSESPSEAAPSGAAPTATETPKEKGKPDASSQQKAATVYGDLQSQPVEGAGQVPIKEGGERVQPQAESSVQKTPAQPEIVRPPGVKPDAKEWVTAAAYNPSENIVETGPNHPSILEKMGVKGFESRESRNTPQFGYSTNLRPFVTREEAVPVIEKSGQKLEEFETPDKPHSDEVQSPTQPGVPLSEAKGEQGLVSIETPTQKHWRNKAEYDRLSQAASVAYERVGGGNEKLVNSVVDSSPLKEWAANEGASDLEPTNVSTEVDRAISKLNALVRPETTTQRGMPPTHSDVPPGQSATSAEGEKIIPVPAEKGKRRVAYGRSMRARFHRETEAGGPDILSWIEDNMKLLSKSAAKTAWGPEKFKQNQSLWDDAAPLARPHHNVIYDANGFAPDQVAQAAYEAGVLKSPSVNELWSEIDHASKTRHKAFEEGKRQEKFLDQEQSEHEAWIKATSEGRERIKSEDLKVGDLLQVEDQEIEVTAIDPDSGMVTVKDGRKFGIQKLSEGQSIYVESHTPVEEIAEFLPKEKPAPETRKSAGLFPEKEMPFNLAGEKFEFVEPKTEKTGYGAETLAQDELFAIQKVVESKDPTKSANAAQAMYGGAKQAVEKLQNQLRVIDSDPKVAKSFTGSQRAMLKEVVALLRQRAATEPVKPAIRASTGDKLFLYKDIASGELAWAMNASKARDVMANPDQTPMRVSHQGVEPPEGFEKQGHLANDPIVKIASLLTPQGVLKASAVVRVKAPEGATQIRVTDSKGRSSVQPISAINKGENPFRGVDIARIEAGTIGKDKKFSPIKGDMTVEDASKPKPEKEAIVGMGAAATYEFPKEESKAAYTWRKSLAKIGKFRDYASHLWISGRVRDAIAYTKDAGDTQATIFSKQMANEVRNSLKRAFSKEELKSVSGRAYDADDALSIVVEAKGNMDALHDMRAKVIDSSESDPYWKKRFVDAADFALYHWTELETISRKYNAITDAQLAAENAAAIDTLRREGYVMHAQEVDEGIGLFGQGSGESGAFLKVRTHDTFADSIAAGVDPKTLSATDLLQSRIFNGQRRINSKAWMNGLREMKDAQTKEPIAREPLMVKRADGSSYPQAPKGYGLETLGRETVAVHAGYEGLLNAVTQPSVFVNSQTGQAFMKGIGAGKSISLLFDTFHLGRVAYWESLIKSLGVSTFKAPFPSYKRGVTLLDFTPEEIRTMSERGEIPSKWVETLNQDKESLDALVKAGYNIGRVSDALYQDWIHNIPLLGKANKWIFDSFQRGAMAEVGLLELERAKIGRLDMPLEDVARMVSKDLNVRFGNMGRQGIFKSKTYQDIARGLVLAPQWNEGLIRSELGAVKELGQFAVDTAKGKRIYSGVLLRSVGAMALAQFAANQLINYITRGKPTWENEEEGLGAKLSAWIPDKVGGGPGFFLHPLALAAETTHLLLQKFEKTGDFRRSIMQYLRSRASVAMRPIADFITNEDFLGRKLRPGEVWGQMAKDAIPRPIGGQAYALAAKELVTGKHTETFAGQFQKQLMSSVGIKTDSAPTPASRIASLAKSFNEQKGIVPSAEFYVGDYLPVSSMIALKNEDEANAAMKELLKKKTPDQIRKHFREWPNHPFTGKRSREYQFKATLSPEQKDQYKKAVEQRREIGKNAIKLLRKTLTKNHQNHEP